MNTLGAMVAFARRRELFIAAALFTCLASALVYALCSDGITTDEPEHVAAGYRYVAYGDYRPNPEHPPVIKLWAGLPLLALDVAPPPLEQADPDAWLGSFIDGDNLHVPMVPWARVPMVLWTLCLAALLWHIARTLYGVGWPRRAGAGRVSSVADRARALGHDRRTGRDVVLARVLRALALDAVA